MSHWSGLKPVTSATSSILAILWTSLRYPVLSLCHGDSADFDLHIRDLYMLQQFTDELDVGVGQLSSVSGIEYIA